MTDVEIKVIAHRGFSGRQPEMTRAAYVDAINWALEHEVALGVECDVHFSADDQLVCLHDLEVDRTSNAIGAAFDRTVTELRDLDFGSWFTDTPTEDQQSMVTLAELVDLVRQGRERDGQIELVVETKHENPRGLDIEDRVAKMLTEADWDGIESPARLISFSVPSLERFAEVLPNLSRTFLIMTDFREWTDGSLPAGVEIMGPSLGLVKKHPDVVRRVIDAGHEVHVWTVNTPRDVEFCLDLGVTGLTTDFPDAVFKALGRTH
ncbi:MAG: glycerophosphodiester phosphodiesterase [Propionibacteriaceae bacterium]